MDGKTLIISLAWLRYPRFSSVKSNVAPNFSKCGRKISVMKSICGAISAFVPPRKWSVDGVSPNSTSGKDTWNSNAILLKYFWYKMIFCSNLRISNKIWFDMKFSNFQKPFLIIFFLNFQKKDFISLYPAVRVSAVYSPPFNRFGLNSISVDPICTPFTWALQMLCASCIPLRCCAAKPGFLRPARILKIRIGLLVNPLNPIAIRRIWPP